MEHDQAMHAQFRKAFGGIEADSTTRGHAHLQVLEGAPSFLTSGAQFRDTLRGAVKVKRKSEPSPCQPRGTAIGVLAMAAEDDLRMRLLHRTRHRIDAAERHEASAVLRLFHRP